VKDRYGLDAGQLKEVSASPSKQKARTDWTFSFADTTIAPLPQGEPRIDVSLAGSEVTWVRRYVFVPEAWDRDQRAAATRNLVVQIATSVFFGGLLLAAAIGGMIAWSRRRNYAPKYFLGGTVLMLLVSVLSVVNGWPTVVASLTTAAPLPVQLAGVLAVGLVGLTLLAALVGLAIGALPNPLAQANRLPERDAVQLGIAAGLAAPRRRRSRAAIRTPVWARFPGLEALGTALPPLQQALEPVAGYLTRMTVLMTVMVTLDRITASWTRRRWLPIATLAVLGFLAGGPAIGHAPRAGGRWRGSSPRPRSSSPTSRCCASTSRSFHSRSASWSPSARSGAASSGAFPVAIAGAVAGAIVIGAIAWLWFRALRRRAATPEIHPAI
jgi:hypothetical protein